MINPRCRNSRTWGNSHESKLGRPRIAVHQSIKVNVEAEKKILGRMEPACHRTAISIDIANKKGKKETIASDVQVHRSHGFAGISA